MGLLCSAVYLVPALVQREAVHLEWIRDSPFGAFPRNFIYRDETAYEIDVPAGRHEVEVELAPTRDRRIGAALSVLGAILLVLLRRG